MATPKVVAAKPQDALSGYKYTALVAYRDGSEYRLCGCMTKKDGQAICAGWMKTAKKSTLADILVGA